MTKYPPTTMRLCKHNCGRPSAKNRTECETCKYNRFKANNEIRVIWHHLQDSAKRRFKEFDLPFPEFKQKCEDANLLQLRGREGHCLTVDRKDGSKGYTLDNIQFMTRSENSAKYHNKDCEYSNAIYGDTALDSNDDAPF